MAEPADKGEAEGGGVPCSGAPKPGSQGRGLEWPRSRAGEPAAAPQHLLARPASAPAARLPGRLFSSVQLGLPLGARLL